METVTDFIFWGCKITADSDCSHEIKRHLLLERKAITNLDSLLKSRDITLPTKMHLIKAWFFQWSCMDVRVGLWRKVGPKNWCFWTVVLEKILESPLDRKEIQQVHPKGNKSWVFIGRIDAKAETPILLTTWYKELTHWKRPWGWERLKVGGEGDDTGWNGWMVSPAQWIWIWISSGSWWWTGKPGVLQSTRL